MRSSRRNLGLNPEFTPEPTPPASSDENFRADFQIETTLEEEDRYRREENERNESSEVEELENDSTRKEAEVADKAKAQPTVSKDIIFSSDTSSNDDSSDESVKVIEKERLGTKSSENHELLFLLIRVIYSTTNT